MGGWAFILPNFVIVAALGALYVYLGDLQPVIAIFYGVSPAVIALILHSCTGWQSLAWKTGCNGRLRGSVSWSPSFSKPKWRCCSIGAGIVGILYYGSWK